MKTAAILSALLLSACSSVQMMDGSEGANVSGSCNVRVYMTKGAAEKNGPIDELCVISGDSSFTLGRNVAAAIEKHKSKACGCGATNVYVQSQVMASINEQAQVTMVAFRYVQK